MTGFVIPYETHQTTSRVWAAWWGKSRRLPLALRLQNLNGEVLRVIPLEAGWSSIGLEGEGIHEVVCEYQVVALNDLQPATTYRLTLIRPNLNIVIATALVETLPDRLYPPGAAEFAQRPFTILLGSCYYAPDDTSKKVSGAYRRVWDSPGYRPHIKILCGDQVYLDQPAGPDSPMRDRMSSEDLRRWMIAKYRHSWINLQDLLQRGANFLTSDDHEFWNDYPERPLIWAWRALYQSLQYRRDWGREAVAHFREIQQGANVTQIDIGTDLSIFIADTRINRQRDRLHFMSADDFSAMVEWIRGLEMPGVLVVGQPLLATPINSKAYLGRILTDRNLPYFVQYDDLINALHWWCKHDLLILAGDVHHGRIARMNVVRTPDPNPVIFHEVVSSGMTVLPTAKDRFRIGPDGAGYPDVFPPYQRGLPNRRGGRVRYMHVVPPMQGDEEGTENHFMTLEFTRRPRGGGVEVNVRAWLVEHIASSGLPRIAWTYTCGLDTGRPDTAAMTIAPPIIDLGHVARNTLIRRDGGLVVTSAGTGPLVIETIRLQGAQADAFSLAHPLSALPATLQPGAAFPISIRFQGASVGEHQARVVLSGLDDRSGSSVIAEAVLLAHVVAPDMDVLPTRISFGSVQVGRPTLRNVAVSNFGSAPLRFRASLPAPQSPFQWQGDAADHWRKLLPGAFEDIPIQYKPAAAGVHSTKIVFKSDDETIAVALEGEAVTAPLGQIRANPRQLSFGLVSIGTTATRKLALANDGAGPLAIRAARIEGPDRTMFALPSRPPTVIQAGQTTSMAVAFAPAAMITGGHHATLIIESNAGNDPQLSVGLFGAGSAPNLRVAPMQIAFNPSPLASTLPSGLGSTRGLDLYNLGADPLTIAASSFQVIVTASGQVSPHYTILGPTGQPFPPSNLSLNGGVSASLSILFRPITAGDHPARIAITPTDPTQPPVTVSITGQGVE